jgi:purine-nucleoside phosphorylase
MTNTVLAERAREAADHLRGRGVGVPRASFVLGSGLSGALRLERSVRVPFDEVPGFPRGALAGHDRVVEFGEAEGVPVLVLRGRAHHYEGISLADATFPIRVLRALGAPWVALANACGGIDPTLEVGDVVLITDHLNLMGDNPLVGPNDDALGPRFPDMSRAYDRGLLLRAEEVARSASITTRRGVYAAVPGPHYETPAEIRMLRTCGADLVGMSTVPETIVAVHGGMKVLGISIVTDLAHPESLEPLTHDEVVRAAERARPHVDAILRGLLKGEVA